MHLSLPPNTHTDSHRNQQTELQCPKSPGSRLMAFSDHRRIHSRRPQSAHELPHGHGMSFLRFITIIIITVVVTVFFTYRIWLTTALHNFQNILHVLLP
jgi:hypothetical protein